MYKCDALIEGEFFVKRENKDILHHFAKNMDKILKLEGFINRTDSSHLWSNPPKVYWEVYEEDIKKMLRYIEKYKIKHKEFSANYFNVWYLADPDMCLKTEEN